MPKLVKNNRVSNDNWQLVAKGETIPTTGKVLVNVADWSDELSARGAGLWLDSDQPPEQIRADVNSLPLIAINFPVFTDGRGYSYASLLRKELAYTGELRAIGDVLRDQMFYMQRCGFDAFAVREDHNADAAIASLSDFDNCYQAAADDPLPLFAKRWQ